MSSTVFYIVIGSIVFLILAVIALIFYGEYNDEIANENSKAMSDKYREQFDCFMEQWNWEDDPKKQWKDVPCTVKTCTATRLDKRIQTTLGSLFEGLKPMMDKYALETVAHPWTFLMVSRISLDVSNDSDTDRPYDMFHSACESYINAKREQNKAQFNKLAKSIWTRKKENKGIEARWTPKERFERAWDAAQAKHKEKNG